MLDINWSFVLGYCWYLVFLCVIIHRLHAHVEIIKHEPYYESRKGEIEGLHDTMTP
jgi:hypothetical protein